jgi:hypothetical protein
MKTDYAGIDYGMGKANIDRDTGIRYGVISQNEVLQAWTESSEAVFPELHLTGEVYRVFVNGWEFKLTDEYGNVYDNGKAWHPRVKHSDKWSKARATQEMREALESAPEYPDEYGFDCEPTGYFYNNDGYHAGCGNDGDIFITKSPYYTTCQFASPCAPGAGYIMTTVDNGVRTYCFGHDWFNDGKAPYPVFDVKTGKQTRKEG